MPQPNDVSEDIQDPLMSTESMDFDFSINNKRKSREVHTQRPNFASQFSPPPLILPVIINLISEPKSFSLLSFSERQFFIKELSIVTGTFTQGIKWSRNGELVIYPVSRKQKDLMLRLDFIKEFQVKSSVSKSESESRGIIYNVPTNNTEEDLLHLLADQGVKSVKRFHKTAPDNTRCPLTTVAITFTSPTLPAEIVIAHQLFKVKKYIPRPLICFKCWKLGHSMLECPNAHKCKSCASTHDPSNVCLEPSRCPTCGLNGHPAASMECPVYAKRQDTIKFAYDNNISIPEAIRACNDKIAQSPKSPHISPQQPTEIDSLKKEVERLRESLEQFQVKTTEELKSLSAKAEATDVEISTIKSQVIPLISLPTIVEDIKTNTEEGFKSTIEKLNLLFDLFKNNNVDGPPQKKTPIQPNISQLRNTRPNSPPK